MSYHNGSVWPHDNALIAMGLARYGLQAATARLFEGMFEASLEIDLRRLPELFCGFTAVAARRRPHIRWPARRRPGPRPRCRRLCKPAWDSVLTPRRGSYGSTVQLCRAFSID